MLGFDEVEIAGDVGAVVREALEEALLDPRAASVLAAHPSVAGKWVARGTTRVADELYVLVSAAHKNRALCSMGDNIAENKVVAAGHHADGPVALGNARGTGLIPVGNP